MILVTTTSLLLLLVLISFHPNIIHASSLSFETLASGDYSDITEPRQEVYRSSPDFKTFWHQHIGGSLPSVDFQKTMVISAFRGDQKSGGYDITVESITETNNEILVVTKTSDPNYDEIVAMVITQPFQVVIMKASSKPVYFCNDNAALLENCVQASRVESTPSGTNRNYMNNFIATWIFTLFIGFVFWI